MWNIDLLDTHLDLLVTDIPGKTFVCLHSVLKMSSVYVFNTASRHVFKTSSRHFFKTSSRRLQRNNFSSPKTPSRRLARYLQDVLEDIKLLRWRCVEDVFKTCLQDVLKTNKCLLGSNTIKFDKFDFLMSDYVWCVKNQMLLATKLGISRIQ